MNDQAQIFLLAWFGALGVMAAFAVLHSLSHYCAWVASEWLRRRRASTVRVQKLGEMSDGWRPDLQRLRSDDDLAALRIRDAARRAARRRQA